MVTKTHPTTIRLSEAEQTFLASLDVPGASSISDKIRALLADKQRQVEAPSDYQAAIDASQHIFHPIKNALLVAEKQHMNESQLLHRLVDWLIPVYAELKCSAAILAPEEASLEELHLLEKNTSAYILRLLDSILQSYIARESALYQSASIDSEQLHNINKLLKNNI